MQLILKEASIRDLMESTELVILMLEHISCKVILNDALILLIVHGLDQRRIVISQLSDLLLVFVVLVGQQLYMLHFLLFFSNMFGDLVLEMLHF